MPLPEFREAYVHGIFENQTIHIVVQSTLSGSRVRLRLSNQYGKQPLTIGAARIVRLPSGNPGWRGTMGMRFFHGPDGAPPRGGIPGKSYVPELHKPMADTEREILFKGRLSVDIPAGGIVDSDPVGFDTGYRGYMRISLYLPKRTELPTFVSGTTLATVELGDTTRLDREVPKLHSPLPGAFWLVGVEVFGSDDSKAILIIDDDRSWRDGREPGAGWHEPFKDRLLTKVNASHFAVLSASMPDCAMTQPCGASILERIGDAQRNRRGVRWVILSAGFQDILNDTRPHWTRAQPPNLSAEDLIHAQKTIADAAHAAGLKIYGVTYPPFAGTWEYTQHGEALRLAVNAWIRESGAFDAIADFDRVLSDLENPSRVESAFGRPNALSDDAFRAMAEAFDPSVF